MVSEMEPKPIGRDTFPGRYLLWVANGGPGGKGAWAFGRVFQFPDETSAVAEGYAGDVSITHFLPIPGAPRAAISKARG